MPRLPRLRTGDGQPPQEQEHPAQPTRELSSGDPLSADAPRPETAPPARQDLTSGDPLATPAPQPGALAAVEGPDPATPAAFDPADAPTTAQAPVASDPLEAQATPRPDVDIPTAEPLPGEPAAGEDSPAVGSDEWASGQAAEPSGSDALWAEAPAASDPLAAEPPTTVAPPPAASTSAAVAAPGATDEPQPLPQPQETEVVEHAPADATPRFRERTRLRRRMRELRRIRELAFRDLGGLVFDLHRFGRDRTDLVGEKLEALTGLDHELRTIETALRERRDVVELREAGIAACPRCATLHGTDANFCPGCGTPLRGSVVREAGPLRVAPATEAVEGAQPAEGPSDAATTSGDPLTDPQPAPGDSTDPAARPAS